MNPVAFLLALLVHLLALAPLAVRSEEPEKKKPEVRLLGGNRDLVFRRLEGTGTGLACADTYDGVGVRHNWGGQITDVAPGGPAERAGVKVGDEYVASGDEGAYRTLRYRQGGVERVLRVKRETICQDEA